MVKINGRETSIGDYTSADLPVTLAYVDVTSAISRNSPRWLFYTIC